MLVKKILPSTSGLSLGELVDVTLANNVSMGVAAPSTLRLTGQRLQTTADLTPGQEVLAEITGNIAVANDGNPSFTTVKLLLASSQIAGPVAAVNSSAGSFALTNIWSLFTKANPAVTTAGSANRNPNNVCRFNPCRRLGDQHVIEGGGERTAIQYDRQRGAADTQRPASSWQVGLLPNLRVSMGS